MIGHVELKDGFAIYTYKPGGSLGTSIFTADAVYARAGAAEWAAELLAVSEKPRIGFVYPVVYVMVDGQAHIVDTRAIPFVTPVSAGEGT